MKNMTNRYIETGCSFLNSNLDTLLARKKLLPHSVLRESSLDYSNFGGQIDLTSFTWDL